MFKRDPENEWKRMGKTDPYYGVISMDQFRQDKMTKEVKDQFFESGEQHISYVFDTIHTYLDTDFDAETALDYGCGTARCTIPLAQRCEKVIGLDVSEAMLAEAELNCKELKVDNVSLSYSDHLEQESELYDLVHCFIVFQHIPPVKGEQIFSAMLNSLKQGGCIAVQFVYYREVSAAVKMMGGVRKRLPPVHALVNFLNKKPLNEPLMEKNCYDLNEIFHILQMHGCGNVHVAFQGKGKLKSVVVFAQKKAAKTPYDLFYNEDSEVE